MTSKERAQLARLKSENARLREEVARHLEIYRQQAWELIDLRTRLDLVQQALQQGYTP